MIYHFEQILHSPIHVPCIITDDYGTVLWLEPEGDESDMEPGYCTEVRIIRNDTFDWLYREKDEG